MIKPNATQLFVDPGVEMGVVLWDTRSTLPLTVEVLRGYPRSASWKARCDDVMERFGQIVSGDVDEVYCEYPQFMQSVGGMRSARGGDLVKLSIMCGRIQECAYEHGVPTFSFVEIPKWKGNLPKRLVNDRIRKSLPKTILRLLSKAESHDWDAMGMALWKRGGRL